jgi:uncharacterized protein YdbL (DUF1318 family)
MRRLLSILLIALSALALHGQDMNTVRARMNDRLPQVVQMLRNEAVGENNQGLLTVRGNVSEDEAKVVAAENADRTELYSLLAKREGLKPEEVARAQARQLAKLSAKGFWIQDEEGEWSRKP